MKLPFLNRREETASARSSWGCGLKEPVKGRAADRFVTSRQVLEVLRRAPARALVVAMAALDAAIL